MEGTVRKLPLPVLENCGRWEEESGVQIRETLGHSMRTWGRMHWDYLRGSTHTAARARTAPGQLRRLSSVLDKEVGGLTAGFPEQPLLLCDSAAWAQATVQ